MSTSWRYLDGIYLFLYLPVNDGLFMLIVYNDLNIIYVIIQDLLIIPVYWL